MATKVCIDVHQPIWRFTDARIGRRCAAQASNCCDIFFYNFIIESAGHTSGHSAGIKIAKIAARLADGYEARLFDEALPLARQQQIGVGGPGLLVEAVVAAHQNK